MKTSTQEEESPIDHRHTNGAWSSSSSDRDDIGQVVTAAPKNDAVLANLTFRDVSERGTRFSRAFLPWNATHEHSWCYLKKCWQDDGPNGLLYTKVPKTASSTLESIAIRMGRKHGQESEKKKCCGMHQHNNAGTMYGNRQKERSFLWSMMRDPARRALSRVFFTSVSWQQQDPTDDFVIRQLKKSTNRQFGTISDGQGGFQMRYLSLDRIEKGSAWTGARPTVVLRPNRVEGLAKQIVQDYDFLAVVERLDESIVALQLLLGLDTGDVLTLSSKRAGQYHAFDKKSGCVQLQKSFASPAVREYLSSPEWIAQNYGDYLLYHASNRSLDMTIERIGRPRFAAELKRYREAMALVDRECSATAIFPCSVDGQAQFEKASQNCYLHDSGCGYRCIDRVWENYKLSNSTLRPGES